MSRVIRPPSPAKNAESPPLLRFAACGTGRSGRPGGGIDSVRTGAPSGPAAAAGAGAGSAGGAGSSGGETGRDGVPVSGGTFTAKPGAPVELSSKQMPAGTKGVMVTMEADPEAPKPAGPEVLRAAGVYQLS